MLSMLCLLATGGLISAVPRLLSEVPFATCGLNCPVEVRGHALAQFTLANVVIIQEQPL
jgi:hypothetical protein